MKIFVLDFETFLLRPAQQAPRAVCLALEDLLLHARFDRDACLDILTTAFSDPDAMIVGAHLAFDLVVACHEWPSLWPLVWAKYDAFMCWDVQHAEKLIDLYDGKLPWHPHPTDASKRIRVSYNLADIVERRFGVKLDKDTWRKRYGTLYGIPCSQWEQGARDYPVDDARWTRKLFDLQITEPEDKLVDVTRQCRAAWWMYLMTVRGFRVDRDEIVAFEKRMREEMARIAAMLQPAGLVTHDGKRSVKAASDYLLKILESKGLAPVYTPTGKVQLSEEQCADSGDPLLEAYARWTSLTGMLTKVATLREAAEAGAPIQSRFEVLVASGRASCSGGKPKSKSEAGPNRTAYGFQLHNPNREPGLRECFVPRQGYVLVSNDYGQLELCTWAEVCEFLGFGSELGKALNAGVDVHCKFGAALFNYEYEWVLANCKDKKGPAGVARQAAKPFNFGLPGGMRAKGIVAYAKASYGVHLELEEAESHIHAWETLWPESRPYFDFVKNHVQGGWGRIRQIYSNRVRGGVGFTDGCNCVDFETEALTERGWVKGLDLRRTDRLLTKNAETGALEWQTPTAIHLYPDRVGPLVEFRSTRFSAVTTPDHRWLVFDKKTRKDICTTSEKISRHGDHRIHRTGTYEAPDAPHSDDFIELVGWVLTDGSLDKSPSTRIRIYQTKRREVQRIDALFRRLGFDAHRGKSRNCVVWGFTDRGSGGEASRIRALFPERLLTPEFVRTLSARQARVLFDTMMLGDGTRTRAGLRTFFTRSETAAEAFQMLCVLAGEASKAQWRDLSKHRPKKYDSMPNIPKAAGIWEVRIYRRDKVQVLKHQVREYVDARGVWCPEVPNTYFVARRAGTVYVTGNTLFQGLAADAAKSAGYEVARAMYTGRDSRGVAYPALEGSYLLNFVHDELIFESPADRAHDAAMAAAEIMERVAAEWIPHVPPKVEPALMRRWSKEAGPVYKDGRLVPWEPKV